MKLTATENGVIFQPETDWEVEQLERLDEHRTELEGDLIEATGDSYPPSMKMGAQFIIFWKEPEWGT